MTRSAFRRVFPACHSSSRCHRLRCLPSTRARTARAWRSIRCRRRNLRRQTQTKELAGGDALISRSSRTQRRPRVRVLSRFPRLNTLLLVLLVFFAPLVVLRAGFYFWFLVDALEQSKDGVLKAFWIGVRF